MPSSLNEKLPEKSFKPKPSLSKAVTMTLILSIEFALGLRNCYPSWPEDIRQQRTKQFPQNSETQFGVSLQPWASVWMNCKNSSSIMHTLISFGKMQYNSINWRNPVSPRAWEQLKNTFFVQVRTKYKLVTDVLCTLGLCVTGHVQTSSVQSQPFFYFVSGYHL